MDKVIIVEEHIITGRIQIEDKKHVEQPPKVIVPKDKELLCHIYFFIIGICRLLPLMFISNANNFWLYKFRNTTDISDSAENRTVLQKNFMSSTMIVNTIPGLIFAIFNVTHGNRFKIISRVLVTTIIYLAVFVVFTISVVVDTDDFQVPFFILVLVCCVIMSGATMVNVVSSMGLYPRFPHKFMKTSLLGEGVCGIFADILNVFSIAIFPSDVTKSTLLYFIVGTALITLMLVMTITMARLDFFKECLNSLPLDTTKKIPSRQQIGKTLYLLRYIFVLQALVATGMSAGFPSIAALVVSENQKDKTNIWARSYFSPVMTFLLTDCSFCLGRVISSFVTINMSDALFAILAVITEIVVMPLLWFCNAQPRQHLPVLFPHDYQYGLILFVFAITNGYFLNSTSLFIPRKVSSEESDMAYTLLGLGFSIMQTISSPIGLFIVNIL